MFISTALAADPTVAAAAAMASTDAVAGPSSIGNLMSFAPVLLVLVVFYFMVIRPQGLRIRAHRKLIDGLKKGDKVVTGGGLIATVVKAPEGADEVTLRISEGVEVVALRTTVMSLHGEPKK